MADHPPLAFFDKPGPQYPSVTSAPSFSWQLPIFEVRRPEDFVENASSTPNASRAPDYKTPAAKRGPGFGRHPSWAPAAGSTRTGSQAAATQLSLLVLVLQGLPLCILTTSTLEGKGKQKGSRRERVQESAKAASFLNRDASF